MSNRLFYSQFNVDNPEAHSVISIPMETTLYTGKNAHIGKYPFWKKGPMLGSKLGALFQGLVYQSKGGTSPTLEKVLILTPIFEPKFYM